MMTSKKNAVQRINGVFVKALESFSTKLGLGGDKDALSEIELNELYIIPPAAISTFYRKYSLIQKLIDTLPVDAAAKKIEIQCDSNLIDIDHLHSVLETLPVLSLGRNSTSLKEAIVEASILGRLYGDGYILIGIDDGEPFDRPVNEQNIRSIEWLAPRSNYYIIPHSLNSEYYYVTRSYSNDPLEQMQNDRSKHILYVHESRILKFPGKRLWGEDYWHNGYCNDPLLQGVFNEWVQFVVGKKALSSMLDSHSLFKYKLKGLDKLSAQNEMQSLLNRFDAMFASLSVIKGIPVDADREDAEFINRNYSGAEKVMDMLIDLLVAAFDMPRSKILNASGKTAFSEGGESDRYEWAAIVRRYQENRWKPELNKLIHYMLLSDDCPEYQQAYLADCHNRNFNYLPLAAPEWSISFPSILQLTDKEEADLKLVTAQTDEIYLRNNVLSPTEIRNSRFANSEWSSATTLSVGDRKKMPTLSPTTPLAGINKQ